MKKHEFFKNWKADIKEMKKGLVYEKPKLKVNLSGTKLNKNKH